MIPISTCLSDPPWYQPPEGEEYFIDKRGVVNGLRYEPLIVQREAQHGYECPCQDKRKSPNCEVLVEYEELLFSLVDKEKTLAAFEHCANKFKKELGFEEEPIIVLIVYEVPTNTCSERYALQR